MRLVALLSIGLAFLSGIAVCLANETLGEALENQGDCPPTKWLSYCSPPVAHDCVVDVDCGLNDKCCYNGCYMTCKAPYEGKLRRKRRICAQPVDLVFMIDSSESFGLENFEHVKKMAHKTLNVFAVSEKKTHVGVIVIDSVPHIELNLTTLKGKNLTAKNVMKVVDGLQFTRGQTRIDLALRMTQKEIFSKLGGTRKDARKILLVFTDGLQTWDPRTTLNNRKLSDQLVKAGVQIFPVAVWKEDLNIGTLTDIASNLHHIFNLEFYPYLLKLLKKISKGPCPGDRNKNVWENTLKKMTKKE